MTRPITYLIVCLLMCMSNCAHAGIMAVESDAGLPDKFITAICRDGRGLMWIGTRQGLCMYDGHRFLPLSGVLQYGTLVNKLLYNARADILWVATDKGLFSIRCNSLRITSVVTSIKSAVTDICLCSNGNLFVAYRSGEIISIDTASHERPITRLPSVANKSVYASRLAYDGTDMLNLRIPGRDTVYRLQVKTGLLYRYPSDSVGKDGRKTKWDGSLLFIDGDDEGNKLINNSGTNEYATASGILTSIPERVMAYLTRSGILYVLGKPSSLYRFDLLNNRRDTISSDVFAGRLFTCFYIDPEHIVWIGSNKGLIKITEDKRLFDHLLFQVPSISIRTLAEDETGNIYAGTYSGLFMSRDRGVHWSKLDHRLPYKLLNVPGRYLYFVEETLGLCRINKKTLKVDVDFHSTEGIPADDKPLAYSMAIDEQGTIWIGTSNGLVVYDPTTNILAARKDIKGLAAYTRVYYIKIRQNGRLLLCTDNGLFEVDKQAGVVWHLNTKSKPALSNNYLRYVDEDAEGRLWVCTNSSGLNIISRDGKQVSALRTADGLSDNETYQFLWQGPYRLWISTFNGLSSYNLQTQTFYNYYASDGLTSNEFNHNSFLRDRTGRIYFGTINGINAFYPDSITNPENKVHLFVSGITKWDNKAGEFITLVPTDTASPIILEPLDHSLTFNLALTDYNNPENNIFRYRLKGLFDEWVPLDGKQVLRLDGLAAGSYVLEIMALDSRGTPAVNMLHYHLRIHQPFYKSGWFYLILFLLASGLLWAFFVLRLQQLRRVQRLREQIASDLHDEVGSLLTRITMTSDNLRYSKNAETDKTNKLEKIGVLSRKAASSMSDILWAIDARNDYTGNLADRMREHAEEMLLPINIDVHFDFNVNQRMSIPSHLRQQLYLIYKEAINNIVKHSTATHVQVSYNHNEQGFKLAVANDGYTEKERVSTGQGLKNMNMRAGRIHAELVLGRSGTNFEIVIKGS